MPRLESFLSFYCLLLIMGGLGRCWWLFSQKILIFPYNHQWFSYYTERCIFRWTLKLILDSKNIYKNNINSAKELQIFPPVANYYKQIFASNSAPPTELTDNIPL